MEALHLQDEEFEQEQSHEDAILEQLIIEGIEYSKGKPPLTIEQVRQNLGLNGK